MFLAALMLSGSVLPPQPMQFQVVRDAITDELRAYATLREDGNVLTVSCKGGEADEPRVSFHSRRWLARGYVLSGDRPVTYRFDDQPPRRMMWDIEDRRGLLENRRRVADFLQGLAGAERLVIRARDVENRRFDLAFRVSGAESAVRQALAACAAAGDTDD